MPAEKRKARSGRMVKGPRGPRIGDVARAAVISERAFVLVVGTMASDAGGFNPLELPVHMASRALRRPMRAKKREFCL